MAAARTQKRRKIFFLSFFPFYFFSTSFLSSLPFSRSDCKCITVSCVCCVHLASMVCPIGKKGHKRHSIRYSQRTCTCLVCSGSSILRKQTAALCIDMEQTFFCSWWLKGGFYVCCYVVLLHAISVIFDPSRLSRHGVNKVAKAHEVANFFEKENGSRSNTLSLETRFLGFAPGQLQHYARFIWLLFYSLVLPRSRSK